MKYPLTISGMDTYQASDRSAQDSAYTQGHAAAGKVPILRRFPPALQFITRPESYIEAQLQAAATLAFKQGRRLDQICGTLYHTALGLGYHVTIGVQEVYSANMPSFPGETVMTALLIIDAVELRPGIEAPPPGYN
ncbi:MAG: hypothetical protein R2834_21035 [Rhodothermales bacterium]